MHMAMLSYSIRASQKIWTSLYYNTPAHAITIHPNRIRSFYGYYLALVDFNLSEVTFFSERIST